MELRPARLPDISSNARIKEYPESLVLQVANTAIFRAAGFEPRVREYEVSPKGKAKDPERALASSRARAKAAIRDIALCNRFEYFLTGTLDREVVDRYDAEAVSKKVQSLLKNLSYRKGLQYLLVPELHKDGAIHFHGMCNPGSVSLVRAVNPHTENPLSTNSGQPIFNMRDWTLGHSTCIPIDGNYERTCNYIAKYITKDTGKILGKWYWASRDLVKKPHIELIAGGMDYDSFVEENPQAPVVNIYRDICMAIMQQPMGNGGETHDPWRMDSAIS